MLLAGSMPNKVAIFATCGKPNNSDMSDRPLKRYSLQRAMARKRTYSTQPRHATNQWLRDALAYCDENSGYLTYDEVATALNRSSLKQTYDRSMIQKMTTIRQISLDEAKVLSQITGFPLAPEQQEESLSARFSRLSSGRQERLLGILDDLEAAEAADQANGR